MKPERDQQPAPTTVEFEVQFSRGPKGKKRVRAAAVVPLPKVEPVPSRMATPRPPSAVAPSPQVAATPTPLPTTERVPKIALLLVLSHHFEQLVREGVVKDYAEIARMTGLTRARITQIVDLTLLAPGIQQEILFIRIVRHRGLEGFVRSLANISVWQEQRGGSPLCGG